MLGTNKQYGNLIRCRAILALERACKAMGRDYLRHTVMKGSSNAKFLDETAGKLTPWCTTSMSKAAQTAAMEALHPGTSGPGH